MWARQIPTLRQWFHVITVEHRGHGASAAAPPGPYSIDDLAGDVVERLDSLGVERAHIAGVSLGGMVAMRLAVVAPDRVDRLVLAGTAAHLPPPEAWLERAALVRASGVDSLVPVLLSRWFAPGFVEGHGDIAAAVVEMLEEVDREAYAACCEAIASMDQRGDLARIQAPTLVLTGALDPVTPPATALALHEAIGGSSLVVVPGASHLAPLERPDAVTAALLDHLLGLPIERGRRVRREVLGDAHVDRSEAAGAGAFSGPFVDFITRTAWGDIWTRPGLDRRTRSCITLTALVALGRMDELALHVAAARRNGLSDEEIAEVLLQCAVYCGVPAANSAFAVARAVLEGG
jgi:3-oxoadipate enol-lactonase/4-carboxymuconolactone decarboxylase